MDKIGKKIKGKSVTSEQKEALVNFMESHPELQKGKFGPNFTHKQANLLWNQIALELNNIVGANKNAEKWRKCWIDMKCNAKSKNVQLKKSRAKTGGGEENLFELDPIEEKISGMIGEVSIFGQLQTAEPIVNFEGYNCLVIDSEKITDQPVENMTCDIAFPSEVSNHDLFPETADITDVHIERPVGNMTYDIPFPLEVSNYDLFPETVDTTDIHIGSRHDILQKSVELTNDTTSLCKDRNTLLKEYYSKKLLLLERVAIAKERIAKAKEEKVEIMKAASSKAI